MQLGQANHARKLKMQISMFITHPVVRQFQLHTVIDLLTKTHSIKSECMQLIQ